MPYIQQVCGTHSLLSFKIQCKQLAHQCFLCTDLIMTMIQHSELNNMTDLTLTRDNAHEQVFARPRFTLHKSSFQGVECVKVHKVRAAKAWDDRKPSTIQREPRRQENKTSNNKWDRQTDPIEFARWQKEVNWLKSFIVLVQGHDFSRITWAMGDNSNKRDSLALQLIQYKVYKPY